MRFDLIFMVIAKGYWLNSNPPNWWSYRLVKWCPKWYAFKSLRWWKQWSHGHWDWNSQNDTKRGFDWFTEYNHYMHMYTIQFRIDIRGNRVNMYFTFVPFRFKLIFRGLAELLIQKAMQRCQADNCPMVLCYSCKMYKTHQRCIYIYINRHEQWDKYLSTGAVFWPWTADWITDQMPTALSLVEITGDLMFGTLDGHIFVRSRAKADVATHDMAWYNIVFGYRIDMIHVW